MEITHIRCCNVLYSKKMTRKDFEIMAPVGSRESLAAAVEAGADAVYFGIEGLNMRSRSSANFTDLSYGQHRDL